MEAKEQRASKWKKALVGEWSWKRLIRSVLFIYLALFVVAVFFAEKLIFFPPPPGYDAGTPDLVQLTSAQGNTVAAMYLKAEPGKPTILYSHGNAEDLSMSVDLYEEWHAAGLGVLAYDYPGYGLSTGSCTESSCEVAAETAWNYLTQEEKIPPSSIVIVGRSVGGGPSVWLASQHESRGLILLSAFKSAFSVRFPIPLFPRDRFLNLERIRHIQTPLLVIHGEDDSLIPAKHGRALFEASPAADKRFLPIAGAGHDDLYLIGGEEMNETMVRFVLKGGN